MFDTVVDAVRETGANTSMIFVPPRFAAEAILEAADAGVGLVVCITEGHTRARHGQRPQLPEGTGDHARRPELPRRDLARARRTSASSRARSARRGASGWSAARARSSIRSCTSSRNSGWGSPRASAWAAIRCTGSGSSSRSRRSRTTPTPTWWSWWGRSAATTRNGRPPTSPTTSPSPWSATSPGSRRLPASGWGTRAPSSPAPWARRSRRPRRWRRPGVRVGRTPTEVAELVQAAAG